MKILTFDNEKSWLDARRGRFTGSKLGDIAGASSYTKSDIVAKLEELGVEFNKSATKDALEELLPMEEKIALQLSGEKKIGYYELIAERIALPETDENAMDRGTRLEEEALECFEKNTGILLKKDLVMWVREDDESIAVSPDGYKEDLTIAGEAKCLASKYFVQALLTKQIPSQYEKQKLQYFIVNDKLETLYFIFYDPRMPVDMFYIEVKREDVQDEIDEFLAFERQVLAQIKEIESQLTF